MSFVNSFAFCQLAIEELLEISGLGSSNNYERESVVVGYGCKMEGPITFQSNTAHNNLGSGWDTALQNSSKDEPDKQPSFDLLTEKYSKILILLIGRKMIVNYI